MELLGLELVWVKSRFRRNSTTTADASKMHDQVRNPLKAFSGNTVTSKMSSQAYEKTNSRKEEDTTRNALSDYNLSDAYDDDYDRDFGDSSDSDDVFDFWSGYMTETVRQTQKPLFGFLIEARPPLIGKNDIRVIRIHPPTPGSEDTIMCDFQRTSLLDPCEYFPLSYAWGTTTDTTETIYVNDNPFSITPNLLAALYKLRDHGTWISKVWVDAICINQANHSERGQQVMLMGQIYSKAKHLIIWLGELEGEHPLISKGQMRAFMNFHEGRASDEKRNQILETNNKMRQRSYFTRRWVIQEVLSCPGPHTILIGDFRLLATNVGTVLQDESQPLEFVPANHLSPASILGSEKIKDREVQNRSLFRNLFDFASKRCSDERDVVYALRSISKDVRYVKVDYTKDATSVYTKLARQWVFAGHLKAVLQLAILQKLQLESTQHLEGIDEGPLFRPAPSWIPTWNPPSARTIRSGLRPVLGHKEGLTSLIDMDEVRLDYPFERRIAWEKRSCLPSSRPMLSPGPPSRVSDMIQSEYDCLRCQGSILVQCEHNPQEVPYSNNCDLGAYTGCTYCFLFATILNSPVDFEQLNASVPIGGTWCILIEPSIAFGVDTSAQRHDATGKQAYVVRTPVYDVPTEDLEFYDSESCGVFKFRESSIVTLV